MVARKALTFAEIDIKVCGLVYGVGACHARLGYADDPTGFVAPHFDAAAYLKRGAGLTGAVDGKQLTFSLWVRRESAPASAVLFAGVTALNGATYRVQVILDITTNKLHVQARNAAGTVILDVSSSALSLSRMHHVIGSFDLTNTGKRWLYVDDVSDLATVTTYTNDTIDLTVADWGIAAYPSGGTSLTGDLGDVWVSLAYLDLSIEANRRKFTTALPQPVDPGEDGSMPTGAAPLIYLGQSIDDFETNLGTGGGFTLAGTIEETTTAGSSKCFNTLGSCQDTPSFDDQEVTLRWSIDTGYNPTDIEAIPSLQSVDTTPSRISLGEDLGQRASVNLSFSDHPHSDIGPGFDPYPETRDYDPFGQGTFWGKFRGRFPNLRSCALRVIRGFLGDALSDMETRHYIVDSFSGPTLEGEFTVIGKDTLKLLDADRAQAPAPSQGFLGSDISSGAGTAGLSPSGIGASYPSSGYASIGGKEIVHYTRSGDTLTLTSRGQYNTDAIAHDAGDRVQWCLRYLAEDASDIIYDLMTTYGGVATAQIPLSEWQDETATFNRQLYTALIAEPTSVRQLVGELVEQAGLAIWWDDIGEEVRLQVLREIPSDAALYDGGIVLKDTLTLDEQPDKRISQVWTYYAQRNPLAQDDPDNYRQVEITVDEDAETFYGSSAIKKILSRWIAFGGSTIAERLNDIQLGRYRDPPRKVGFQLFRSDTELIEAGGGYQLAALPIQNVDGSAARLPFQVTRLRAEADRYLAEGEEIRWKSFDAADLSNRTINISADVNAVTLRDMHDALFPKAVAGDTVTFIVSSGVVVGSTTTTHPAITVGSWKTGVTINIEIHGSVRGVGGRGGVGANGDGDISGTTGEKGGPALYTRFPVTCVVFPGGKIWAGGGGGGGSGCRIYDDHRGGGGGGGSGVPGGHGGNGPGNGESGHPGNESSGGQGGRAWTSDSFFSGPGLSNYRGGPGGGPGQAGQTGDDNEPAADINAGPGGAAGNAIDGASYVALTNNGDIRGLRVN
jgi:hypothetical protein